MKSRLILACSLAIPAFAGTAAPVVTTPVPAPVSAPVATTTSAWAMEIGPTYRWAIKDLYNDNYEPNDKIDTVGADITLIYKATENHSFNLRVGYDYGDLSASWMSSDIDYYYHEKIVFKVHNIYIMPGYRYTDQLTDSLSWYLGANAGASYFKVDDFHTYTEISNGVPASDCGSASSAKKDWGFAISAELGLRYHITDTIYLYGAYQFWTSTAKLKYEDSSTYAQQYHSVKGGVGINF